MARTVLLQTTVRNASGITQIPDTLIVDDSATQAGLELDGTQMLDASVFVTLETRVSTDGGVTYPWYSASTIQGGQLDRHGNPVAVYNLNAGLPGGTGRHIKGDVNVTGGTLSTTVTAYTQ